MEERLILYLLSMNLVFPLALLVAFRAGKLRGLNDETLDEKLADLAFDSVKEQICNRLQTLFNQYMNITQDLKLPGRLTIQDVAAQIHLRGSVNSAKYILRPCQPGYTEPLLCTSSGLCSKFRRYVETFCFGSIFLFSYWNFEKRLRTGEEWKARMAW